jgi:hypothetical protein
MRLLFFLRIANVICIFVLLAACTSTPPTRSPLQSQLPQKFQRASLWQVLWTPAKSRSIVLKAILLSDPAHSNVRLILEKEGSTLLQMDISSASVSARGSLGNWNGPYIEAPAHLQIWVAFALYQKNVTLGKFHLKGNPNTGRFSLINLDGNQSLQATRIFSKP